MSNDVFATLPAPVRYTVGLLVAVEEDLADAQAQVDLVRGYLKDALAPYPNCVRDEAAKTLRALAADPTHRKIVAALANYGANSPQAIARRTGLERKAVTQRLLQMEEAGEVRRIGGRRYLRCPEDHCT
jgi:predicted Rossmann fold nucleotide-binding protein DprA/Smf involved in DNA uptake